MRIPSRFALASALTLTTLGTLGAPATARAQWSRTYEQFYLPGKFNWTFRREYAAADRLFNAFDYGHAILYERLYTRPSAPVTELEVEEYDFITTKLLVNPPNLPLEETAIEINYARMAPEAKMMFDWAHLLHRQLYDVLASENLTQAEKDAKVSELVRYYKTRPDLAFSSVPKNMDLMEAQPYSLAFRQKYPKFNGLIWGYHWLQVGLYEPLMIGKSREERQAGVAAAVARFKQMLEDAPQHMPRVMPMTPAIAPTFAARYPEAAIIFDNLHSMHDVVSDILANNERVPREGKRAALLEAASRYRDATSFTMTVAEWKSMAEMMGTANMGGPAVGFLPEWPQPTVARGATMADAMKGMSHAGMQHGTDSSAAKAMMPAMPGMVHGAAHAPADTSAAMTSTMMEMHERMMRDPVIRERVMADTALRRMMQGMDSTHAGMQHDMSTHRASESAAAKAAPRKSAPVVKAAAPKRAASAGKAAPSRKATPAKKPVPVKKPAAVKKPAPMDHSKMDHSKVPGMKP